MFNGLAVILGLEGLVAAYGRVWYLPAGRGLMGLRGFRCLMG
jgi:hypothetical protein